jgi:hypothetical protein
VNLGFQAQEKDTNAIFKKFVIMNLGICNNEGRPGLTQSSSQNHEGGVTTWSALWPQKPVAMDEMSVLEKFSFLLKL